LKYSAGSKTRPNKPLLSRKAGFLFALLLLAAGVAPCWTAQRVRCEATIGWNGFVRAGRYAPLVVTVENPGGSLEVELRVEIPAVRVLRNSFSPSAYSRSISVAGGSVKRVPFAVPIPNDPGSLDITISSGGERIGRVGMDLRPLVTSDRIIAAVSGEMRLDRLAELSDAGGSVRVVYPHVETLPESWAGYDGIEMVVVRDTSFQRLRGSQTAALERWVFSGGTLVFTGGAASMLHGGAGFGDLLPVEITGMREIGGLPSLGALPRIREGPRGSIVIAEARVRSGKVLAAENGLPVIVQRRLGAGSIWFAAFDAGLPPLDAWQGMVPLWRLLSEKGRQFQDRTNRTAAEGAWMKAFLDSPALSFPSRLFPLLFSAGYLLLLLPIVAIGSRRRARRTRVLVLLAAPVLASAAGYLLFNRVIFHPGARLVEAARVEAVSGDRFAFATEKIGIFSSATRTLDLSIDGRDVLVEETRPIAINSTAGSPKPATVSDGPGGMTLKGVVLGRFEARIYTLRGIVEMPVEGTLERIGQFVAVTVANRSSRSLRDCILALAGIGYTVGNVAPGETLRRTFTASQGTDLRDPALRARVLGGEERAWEWERAFGAFRSEQAALTAWLDGPIFFRSYAPETENGTAPSHALYVVEMK
jgi:hypothetical protein